MPTDQRSQLSAIRTFPSLVRYLRDEMDWPITSDHFDDLTFDYTPEELGIDTANAAKIEEIKRLRPLSTGQPWGIFFVKFEPKRLPVVALRRILSRVVVKKRATAGSAERPAWQMDDLLFISNYGEGEQRHISFAHFSQDREKNDLPTLKVLGWDSLDTLLHLGHVTDELTDHLAWPEDEEDLESWRESWSAAFTLRHKEVITTSRALAVALAELAQSIRNRIRTVLAIETESGPITKLMIAFQKSLIHDLDEDGFADMYAQTISYGLLSARVANPTGGTADDFAAQMPATNPFLKELMETFLDVGGRKGRAETGPGIDFDELGVNDVVELLDDANMEAVVRDFGDQKPQEDPVIHFYELFLEEYDAKKRMQRGVFYTPRPVVSFIVRSVDELLREEFGLEDGLADTTTWGEMAERHEELEIPDGTKPEEPFVQVLDPATGTGTFLIEVIDLIYKTMTDKWGAERYMELEFANLWNEYVPKHLLPRLHGYELLMAPYAIAHMKIGLKLYETGYRFESGERARIYLTNALEPAQDFSDRLAFAIPALTHESKSVSRIKSDQRFTVVIGNPPYASISSNLTPEFRSIVDPYRTVDGAQIQERSMLQFEKNIQDDYIKFFALAQRNLAHKPFAVCALVTNHSFLDGPTLRGVRWNFITDFDTCRFLDLHGNANKGESPPLDQGNENIFDIRQGVAVSLLSRNLGGTEKRVFHQDLWGLRPEKYSFLLKNTYSSIESVQIQPERPNYFIVPEEGSSTSEDWGKYTEITEIFTKRSTGTESGFDALLVAFDSQELKSKLEKFSSSSSSERDLLTQWEVKKGHAQRLFQQRNMVKSYS